MLLYHGTNASKIETILKDGIVPRGDQNSNWSAASQNKFVYLTSAYPFYFAAQACAANEDKDPAIIEVDCSEITPNRFCPDDDFIHFVLKGQGINVTIEKAGSLIKKNQRLWEKSLIHIGCIAHCGKIHPEAIKRIIRIKWNDMDVSARLLYFGFIDISVSPLGFSLLKNRYENAIRWMFGDTDILEHISAGDKEREKILENIASSRKNWIDLVYERK